MSTFVVVSALPQPLGTLLADIRPLDNFYKLTAFDVFYSLQPGYYAVNYDGFWENIPYLPNEFASIDYEKSDILALIADVSSDYRSPSDTVAVDGYDKIYKIGDVLIILFENTVASYSAGNVLSIWSEESVFSYTSEDIAIQIVSNEFSYSGDDIISINAISNEINYRQSEELSIFGENTIFAATSEIVSVKTIDITEKHIAGESTSININSKEIEYFASDAVAFWGEDTIYKNVSSASSIDVALASIQYFATAVNPVNIVSKEIDYSQSIEVSVDISLVPKLTKSDEIAIEIVDGKIIYNNSDIIQISVLPQDPKLVEGNVIPIFGLSSSSGIAQSNILSIIGTADPQKYTASPVFEFDYKISVKKYFYSTVWGESISGVPKWVQSNMIFVDIMFENFQLTFDDQEWIVLRHLGTYDWKFFAVLDDRTLITPIVGATPDIRYHELVHAHQSITLTYNLNGNVYRVLTYGSELKLPNELISDRQIEYLDTFPCRATTQFFDTAGFLYKTVIETFVPGLGNEIIADTIQVIDNNIPCSTIPGPGNPAIVIGDVVYVDGFGIFQPAIATSATTARAVGFVTSSPGGGFFGVKPYGPISGFTGLTPGAKYFVSSSVAGKIQAPPPVNTGFALKKVGIAQNSTTLLINIDETLTVRS